MISITEKDVINILQYVKERDNIKLDNENDIADLLNEMNKKQVIENHPYKISETVKHGEPYFLTYVYDETKNNNRRQITAKSRTDIENKIYKDYLDKQIRTFESVFEEWYKTDYKKKVSKTTYPRTKTDYNRFLKDTKFSKKAISKISTLEVEDFIHTAIIDFKLREQGTKNLKSLLNGVFKYALKKKYITENPVDLAEISFSNVVKPKKQHKEDVVFTTEERDLIKKEIETDTANYKDSVPFAILLSFQLGLRVSELIALKWTDIKKNTIHIQRQEICYTFEDETEKKTIHEIVDYTKTEEGDRILPLSPDALKILDNVKKWNKEHNIKSAFIFADKNGINFNRQRINTRLYKYCEKINISKKSSHKIRRSVISSLLDNVKNKDSVRQFAGHKNIQTTFNSYYKDISSNAEFYGEMCACL